MINIKSFKGVPYPITKTPKGFFYIQHGIDQIKSDLIVLFIFKPMSFSQNHLKIGNTYTKIFKGHD